MAVKIRMLKERTIPILYETGEVGKEYKVNSEVGAELVLKGDAEYVDPEWRARFERKWPKKKEVESAAMDSPEKAVLERPKRRK